MFFAHTFCILVLGETSLIGILADLLMLALLYSPTVCVDIRIWYFMGRFIGKSEDPYFESESRKLFEERWKQTWHRKTVHDAIEDEWEKETEKGKKDPRLRLILGSIFILLLLLYTYMVMWNMLSTLEVPGENAHGGSSLDRWLNSFMPKLPEDSWLGQFMLVAAAAAASSVMSQLLYADKIRALCTFILLLGIVSILEVFMQLFIAIPDSVVDRCVHRIRQVSEEFGSWVLYRVDIPASKCLQTVWNGHLSLFLMSALEQWRLWKYDDYQGTYALRAGVIIFLISIFTFGMLVLRMHSSMTMFTDFAIVILLYDREWLRHRLWTLVHAVVCLRRVKATARKVKETEPPLVRQVPKVTFSTYPGYGCEVPPGPEVHFDEEFDPPREAAFFYPNPKWLVFKLIVVSLFSVGVIGGMGWAYVQGFVFVRDKHFYMAFGLYGTFLLTHYMIQSICAGINERANRKLSKRIEIDRPPSVALQISCYKEDPAYLRECLESIKNTNYSNLQVLLCIDGNSDEDYYMYEVFAELFPKHAFFAGTIIFTIFRPSCLIQR